MTEENNHHLKRNFDNTSSDILITNNWEMKQLKYVTRLAYGSSLAESARVDGNYRVFGSNGEVGKHESANTKAPVIIVGRKGSFGKVNFSSEPVFAIDTTYFIDATQTHHDLRWLFYLLISIELDAISKDTGVPGLSREDAYSKIVPVPPFSVQKKISSFLDQKILSIDFLMAKKERQIELLNEKRQALISHAITKGLNPNVTNRNSGINRPDVIPSHWQVRKISRSFMLIGSGTTPDSNNTSFYENGSIPWLNTGDLNDDYISDIPKKITVQAFKHFSALKIYPSDTVIVALYGATIGKVGILTSEACTNQACCALSKSPFFIPKFVYYWFLSNKKDIIRQSYGGGQPNISQELLKNQMMVSPPLEEQQQIVNFLDFNIQNIDNIIQKIRLQVERLEEFRKSLIKEAITGNFKIGKQEFLNAI